jgi:tRNA pseudouridine synthase
VQRRLLKALEGKRLDWTAFARDTPPAKDCVCTILCARALRAETPACRRSGGGAGRCQSLGEEAVPCCTCGAPATPVLCIELVAERFLRRMVRVLVATGARVLSSTGPLPRSLCLNRKLCAAHVWTLAGLAAPPT